MANGSSGVLRIDTAGRFRRRRAPIDIGLAGVVAQRPAHGVKLIAEQREHEAEHQCELDQSVARLVHCISS